MGKILEKGELNNLKGMVIVYGRMNPNIDFGYGEGFFSTKEKNLHAVYATIHGESYIKSIFPPVKRRDEEHCLEMGKEDFKNLGIDSRLEIFSAPWSKDTSIKKYKTHCKEDLIYVGDNYHLLDDLEEAICDLTSFYFTRVASQLKIPLPSLEYEKFLKREEVDWRTFPKIKDYLISTFLLPLNKSCEEHSRKYFDLFQRGFIKESLLYGLEAYAEEIVTEIKRKRKKSPLIKLNLNIIEAILQEKFEKAANLKNQMEDIRQLHKNIPLIK